MSTATFHVKGIAPLIVSNGIGADPTYELNREKAKITAKRKKVDADLEMINKLDFMTCLYVNKEGLPIIPGTNINFMIIEGAKKSKEGKVAKAGVFVEEDALIEYEGPKTAEKLYADPNHVYRVGVPQMGKRLYKVRPIFQEWAMTFNVEYDDDMLNERQLSEWVETAGKSIGLGTFRPRHGRFKVL